MQMLGTIVPQNKKKNSSLAKITKSVHTKAETAVFCCCYKKKQHYKLHNKHFMLEISEK